MIEHGFTRTSVITRLRCGPLGPHLDALATTLHQHGYAPDSIRRTLRAGEQFGQWLAQHGHAIADVDEALVARYLQTLPRPLVGHWPKAAAGLPHLLRLWRQQGLLPPRPCPSSQTEAAQWLVRYTQYLEHVCGTAPGTRTAYLRIVTRLLTALFGTGRVQWHTVSAQALTDFVRHEAATKHGGGRQLPSVAVRSLLRFLVFSGELAPGLEAAVPIPRQWLHAPLPYRLTVAEVERVLATCTDGGPAALRNHALLLLLARLGVRAHEVAALCLEDINWYEGRVRIPPGKTHHERVLPLVQEVGEAVAAYLQHGRPPTPSRHLFLHCRAPFRPLTDATAISRMAARALRRAGITASARLGAYTFRHTAASQMVNHGARFKDVADVLGHRSLQTTGIYAKLDVEVLAAVALPWMGDAL
jgi:site-specific recombinase XerD